MQRKRSGYPPPPEGRILVRNTARSIQMAGKVARHGLCVSLMAFAPSSTFDHHEERQHSSRVRRIYKRSKKLSTRNKKRDSNEEQIREQHPAGETGTDLVGGSPKDSGRKKS